MILRASDPVIKFKANVEDVIINTRMLVEHILFVGSTGSGKTVTLNHFMRDIVNHYSGDMQQKIGMLVFDFKRERVCENLMEWASECDRKEDIIDFSENGNFYYNFFEGFESYSQISAMADLLVSIEPPDCRDSY